MVRSTGVFLKSILPWKVTVFQRFSLKSGTLWHIMPWFATSQFWGRNGKSVLHGEKTGKIFNTNQPILKPGPARQALIYCGSSDVVAERFFAAYYLPLIPTDLKTTKYSICLFFFNSNGEIWGINPHKKQLIYNLTCTSVLLHDFIKKSHNVKL